MLVAKLRSAAATDISGQANGLPLGWSSIALWGAGLWPSRDNVWTNKTVNLGPDAKWQMRERMPELQSLMAVLAVRPQSHLPFSALARRQHRRATHAPSCSTVRSQRCTLPLPVTAMATTVQGGPYGVADIAGAINRSLVMRACRSDGVLLRPSEPAMALAITFRLSFHDLKPRYLWAARSVIGNYSSSSSHGGLPQQLRYSYLLSINLRQQVVLTPADIDPVAAVPPAAGGGGGDVAPMWVLYEGWEGLARGEVLRLPGSDAPLAIPATPELNAFHAGHSLWCMAPMLEGGWALLGEPSKMVKVRPLQVSCALPTLTYVVHAH